MTLQYDFVIKVDEVEVHKVEVEEVEPTSDQVVAWATNQNERAADAVYKNLVITHDSSTRRFRNLDVKSVISGEGPRVPADTFLLQ